MNSPKSKRIIQKMKHTQKERTRWAQAQEYKWTALKDQIKGTWAHITHICDVNRDELGRLAPFLGCVAFFVGVMVYCLVR